MEDQDICRRLADKLIDIGWRATCDAQHDNLVAAIGELRQMLVPVQMEMLRDQFAGHAMQGICGHPDTWGLGNAEIADQSYLIANEMLRARESAAAHARSAR